MTMDITGIQRILHDAIKEYEIQANAPQEVFVSLISVDIYRRLNAKPVKPVQPKRNVLAKP